MKYETHMSKFKKGYKVVRSDDYIQTIRLPRGGVIYPYEPENGLLVAAVDCANENSKINVKKKCFATSPGAFVSQEGGWDFCLVFPEKDLDKIAPVIGADSRRPGKRVSY